MTSTSAAARRKDHGLARRKDRGLARRRIVVSLAGGSFIIHNFILVSVGREAGLKKLDFCGVVLIGSLATNWLFVHLPMTWLFGLDY